MSQNSDGQGESQGYENITSGGGTSSGQQSSEHFDRLGDSPQFSSHGSGKFTARSSQYITEEDTSKMIQQRIHRNQQMILASVEEARKKKSAKKAANKTKSIKEQISQFQLGVQNQKDQKKKNLKEEKSKAVKRALDIIGQHELQEEMDKQEKNTENLQNLNEIDDKYQEQSFVCPSSGKKDERFSLSQSEIVINDESYREQPNLLEDALRDPEFDIADEDTALLINEVENPYKSLEPQNFTKEQKQNWLQGMRTETEQEFEAQFTSNQQRFKQFDVNFYSQQQQIAMSSKNINHEAAVALDNSKEQMYNVYGQRFHPYGNPYDYQYQNNNMYAAIASNQGALGNQYQSPQTYENKYNFQPILDHDVINSIQPGFHKGEPDSSNFYRTTGVDEKGETKGPSSNFMTFVKYMRHFMGISFLVVPIGLKEIGIHSFAIAIIYTMLVYIFTIWMQIRAEKRLGQFARGIEDLLTLVFGDSIISLYHVIRVMSCIMFITVFNMYLGSETDQILCQTLRGFQCGKFENLIRVGYTIMMVPIIFLGSLKGSSAKIVSIIAFLSILIAFGFIAVHEVLMFEDKTHAQQQDSMNFVNPRNKDKSTILQITSFIALCVTLFDGNTQALKIKSEMQKPKSFLLVTIISVIAFGAICFGFGVLSFLAFGSGMQSPITDNVPTLSSDSEISQIDAQLFLAARMLVVFGVLLGFLTYQNTMFRSVDKFSSMISTAKTPEQPFVYEGQDSNEVEQSMSAPVFYCSRILLLSAALLLSMKLPQQIDLLLQITGGLLGTILTILLPILIFNKTFKNTGKYDYVIMFNWVLFGTSIVAGGLGIYEGVTHMKNMEVLLVIN